MVENLLQRLIKWLYPGMRIKRWILVMAVGVVLISGGVALAMGPDILTSLGRWVTNQLRQLLQQPVGSSRLRIIGIMAGVVGIVITGFGFRQVIRSLVTDIIPAHPDKLADIIFHKRGLGREPAIVVVGGGTGLATMLRGLKHYTSKITAIVTVADDGGSSGRIRSELGIPAPGDIRNTLVALADTEPMMERLFQYRFHWGKGLEGHSFGNLFIAAMADITGDFEEAIRASSQVLKVRGRVLPSTLREVILKAEFADGSTTTGESLIPQMGKRICRIKIEPEDCEPVPEALAAIASADAIILGPGSLYTSILPNLLVQGIRDAIAAASGLKLYICNVMTQPGETDGYRASDHVRAIVDHVGADLIDYVIVNNAPVPPDLAARYRQEGAVPVEPDVENIKTLGFTVLQAPIISKSNLVRHDSQKLARIISRLIWKKNRH